jgi:hypothetical protein
VTMCNLTLFIIFRWQRKEQMLIIESHLFKLKIRCKYILGDDLSSMTPTKSHRSAGDTVQRYYIKYQYFCGISLEICRVEIYMHIYIRPNQEQKRKMQL